MDLVLFAAPAVEPITVGDAIRHLRIGEATGEQRPAAPTLALVASAGNVDNGTHRYRVTLVTSAGETDGGDVSDVITIADKTVAGRVTVSNIPIGSSAVTSRKLYRTQAGGSVYLLLATIADNTTTSYTDNTADSGLGVGAPSVNTTDDPYLSSLIKSARLRVERETGRALVTQQWDMLLDAFPSAYCEPIRIWKPPVQTVDAITYTDPSGATQTLATSVYLVKATDTYTDIALKLNQYWPATISQINAVKVRFTTGYGVASAVPDVLKAAVRVALSDLYIAPNPTLAAQLAIPPSSTFDDLIADYRILAAA